MFARILSSFCVCELGREREIMSSSVFASEFGGFLRVDGPPAT